MKYLNKLKFNHLKELDLSENEIPDISVLEKVNFKELKELDLNSNEINLEENNSIIE